MKIDLKHKPIGMNTMLLSLKFTIFVIWKENSVFKQIRYQDVELKDIELMCHNLSNCYT